MKKMYEEINQSRVANQMSELFEWDRWVKEIPFLNFDQDWDVKIIPPFLGAVVRFIVKKGNREVSVFLDCYGMLGSNLYPYWEIYPDENGDVARYVINDTNNLITGIRNALLYDGNDS